MLRFTHILILIPCLLFLFSCSSKKKIPSYYKENTEAVYKGDIQTISQNIKDEFSSADSLLQKGDERKSLVLYKKIYWQLLSDTIGKYPNESYFQKVLADISVCSKKNNLKEDVLSFYNSVLAFIPDTSRKFFFRKKELLFEKFFLNYLENNIDSAKITAMQCLAGLDTTHYYDLKNHIYFDLSDIYRGQFNARASAISLDSSIKNFIKTSNFDSAQLVIRYSLMVGRYNDLGEEDSAYSYMKKLEGLKDKISSIDIADQIPYYNISGTFFSGLNLNDKAIAYYLKAYTLATKFNDSIYLGRVTGNIGSCCMDLDQYALALPYLKMSNEIFTAYYNNNHLSQFKESDKDYQILDNIYFVKSSLNGYYNAIKKFDSALYFAKEAYSFAIKNLTDTEYSHLHSDALYKVAAEYYNTGKIKAAEKYFVESLKLNDEENIDHELNKSELPTLISEKNNDYKFSLKNFNLYFKLLKKWEGLNENANDLDYLSSDAGKLENIAKMSHDMFMAKNDLKFITTADSLEKKQIGELDVLIDRSDVSAAIGHIHDKNKSVETQIDLYYHKLQLQQVINYEDLTSIFENQKSLLLKRYKYENALTLIPDSSRIVLSILREKNDLLMKSGALFPKGQEYLKYEYFANNFKIDSLSKVIKAFLYDRHNNTEFSLSKVTQKLDSTTALINYVIFNKAIFVLTITKQAQIFKEIDLDSNLENELISYSNHLKDTSFEFKKLSYKFYKLFIAENLPLNFKAINLVIIPDDLLSTIPFEAFITSTQKNSIKYLLDACTIRYEYSMSFFLEEDRKNNNPSNILAIAPDFNFASSSKQNRVRNIGNNISLNDQGFCVQVTPLYFNTKETQTIISKYNGKQLIGNYASEFEFRNNLKKYNVIHFATHAFINPDNANLSCIILKADSDRICLSGNGYLNYAESSTDDNIIYASEIQNMDIGADLIVISACESNIGKYYRGEGNMSLARSFKYANCSNIIATLWNVDDASSEEIITLFYDNLRKGMGKADALAAAKRTFRKGSKNYSPYFWASFILIGDNDPIHLEKNSNAEYWWFLVVVAVLIILIYIVKNKIIYSLLQSNLFF